MMNSNHENVTKMKFIAHTNWNVMREKSAIAQGQGNGV